MKPTRPGYRCWRPWQASGPFAGGIAKGETPTRTRGAEFIARYQEEDLDVIVTHMYLRSSEVGEDGSGRRDVPLNPRQTATFDLLWKLPIGNIGFEVFYTG